jgi:hypothetical protein
MREAINTINTTPSAMAMPASAERDKPLEEELEAEGCPGRTDVVVRIIVVVGPGGNGGGGG